MATTSRYSRPASRSASNFTPRNPAAKEHVARVTEIVRQNNDDGWIIARCHDYSTITGKTAGDIEPAQTYRFLGVWHDHPQYGWQFKFQTYALQTPTSRNGIIRYLTRLCDGIGDRKAEKLHDAYGSEAVEVLRADPARVVAAGLLSQEVAGQASKSLTDNADLESTKLALFDLFAGRGFYGEMLIKECVAKWGATAPDVIRRNPYTLMVEEMVSCGFRRCDKLWVELGHPAGRLKRQMLAGWHELHSDTAGHTWLPIQQAVRAVRQQIGDQLARPERAVRLGLRAKWMRHKRDANGKLWVAEWDRARNEQAIATGVVRLLDNDQVLWPGNPAAWESIHVGERELRLSEHQCTTLTPLLRHAVMILAGTPGTGKTFTAAALIRAVIEQHGDKAVAVCAPTGKAAVRITQAMKAYGLNILATTIHRLLGLGQASFKRARANSGTADEFNDVCPLPQKFIFVDEVSMLDADLAAALIRACADGTHLCLIGDPYQLPPVGHGAPLRDLIAADIPCGELTEIQRNAGMIVRACRQIKDGQSFESAAKYNPDTGDNLRVIDTPECERTIANLDAILSRFRDSGTFHPIWQTQVIVGVNDRGELCRKKLNDRLQTMLNPDGRTAGKNPFRIGDKVICLKNSTLPAMRIAYPDADPAEFGHWLLSRDIGTNQPREIYVANGEIGRVEAITEQVTIARFSEAEECVKIVMGKQREVEDGDAAKADADGVGAEKGRGCNFDLGYVVTVHKAQGSEAPCVIVVADDCASRVASREYWYTAVSRASRLCIIIGSRAVFEKQARKVSLRRRKTFLTELVKEGMACTTSH
jgi:exodeoxyribonuclease V alpha subunit